MSVPTPPPAPFPQSVHERLVAGSDRADDCADTAARVQDVRGHDGQLIQAFGDVVAVLTPSEEQHYGLRSGVRAKVRAIKPSGTAGQPYIEVELLDGSGRTPTFYPSMVEASPDNPRWDAPNLALPAAAPRARALAEISDKDPDFQEQLGLLYPTLKPKDQRKNFKAQRKYGALGLNPTHGQDSVVTGENVMVPEFRRVGGWALHGDDRMDEILEELRPDETPLLGGRGSLVIEKTSVGTAGKAKDWTVQAGSFLITDERFTLNTRLLLSRNRREIQLAEIQSIDVSTVGGIFNRITVRTPAGPVMMDITRNKVEVELIRRTLQEAADVARLRRHQNLQAVPTVVHVQQAPVPSATTSLSRASQVKELFELHQMGAISAAEYESMKAQIIGQDAPE